MNTERLKEIFKNLSKMCDKYTYCRDCPLFKIHEIENNNECIFNIAPCDYDNGYIDTVIDEIEIILRNKKAIGNILRGEK